MDIINLLLENEKLNVTQIYEKIDLGQVEASMHLLLMLKFGILNKVRMGKMSIYSVNMEGLDTIISVVDILNQRK